MIQQEALDLLKMGYNIFLTGAAGSGKTYLLNEYITYLREHGVGVAVTASTGIAATHLDGQTIHSWSGIGIRDALTDEEIEKLLNNSRIRRNFKKANVLVIDEISMLHPHQLDMVERVARRMLDFTKPFGGLQIILCGDFFQLPPVVRAGTGRGGEKTFAYECGAWNTGEFQVCYLEEQFRQVDDPLSSVLNDIRSGTVSESTKVPLRTRYRKKPAGSVYPTRLYVRNVNVDAINERELAKISKKEKVFHMETRGFKTLVDALKRGCIASETLRLKEGAEVMFIKNAADGSYVNGTRGVVESFDEDVGWPLVRTLSGDYILASPDEWRFEEGGAVRASLSQVPLRLAWAITVHKSQGMTLDAAEIDLSDAFEPGMGYVALSRVRSLSGLSLLGLNETALAVHPKILSHDKQFQKWSEDVRTALGQFSDEEKLKRHEDTLFERFRGARDKRQVKVGKIYKKPTYEITHELIEQKHSLSGAAKERGLTEGTILGHLEKLKGLNMLPDIEHLKPSQNDFDIIMKEFEKSEDGKLTSIFEKLGGAYSFDTLKLVRLFV